MVAISGTPELLFLRDLDFTSWALAPGWCEWVARFIPRWQSVE
jgi:hypothetical protein